MITERELRELVLAGYVHPVGNQRNYFRLTEKGREMRRALATVDASARQGTPLNPK